MAEPPFKRTLRYGIVNIANARLEKENEKIFPMVQFVGELDNARILSNFIKKIINDLDNNEVLNIKQ